VSDWITLTARDISSPLAVRGIDPARFAELSEADIARLPVSIGRQQAALGDLFAVSGSRAPRVRIEGSTSLISGLGAGMTGGELEIHGDTGTRTGAGMRAGALHIRGSVGDDAGQGMSGGLLRIDGNAANRLGGNAPGAAKGMTGGEIIVAGTAGAEVGARMRRGLVAVVGNVGREAGRAMIAGSLVVLGSCENPGRGNKRGSIVVGTSVTVPPTYQYACTYQPPHVRLMLRYLVRRFGLEIDNSLIDSTFRRYCGDAGDPGKGEILERVSGV